MINNFIDIFEDWLLSHLQIIKWVIYLPILIGMLILEINDWLRENPVKEENRLA